MDKWDFRGRSRDTLGWKEVIKMETKIQKIYHIQLIDGARFMASSLSSLVYNLSEVIHRTKCKFGHDDKNVKHTELNKALRLFPELYKL